MRRHPALELSTAPAAAPLTLTWPRPVVVASLGVAACGRLPVPEEIRPLVATEPLDVTGLPKLVARLPAARVYMVAMARALAALGDALPAPERRAIVAGTRAAAINEVVSFVEECDHLGAHLVNPGAFPFTVMNAIAGLAAIQFDCRGPNVTINNDSPSALESIAMAADLVAAGRTDLALAGGFESLEEKAARVLRRSPGPVSSAGVLALTTPETARTLGVEPVARLVSFAAGELPESSASTVRDRILGDAERAAEGVLAGTCDVSGAVPADDFEARSHPPEEALLDLATAVVRASRGGRGTTVSVLAGPQTRPVGAALVFASADSVEA